MPRIEIVKDKHNNTVEWKMQNEIEDIFEITIRENPEEVKIEFSRFPRSMECDAENAYFHYFGRDYLS